MKIIKTEKIVENGVTYIVNTYDNGTIEQYIKQDENISQPNPVTLEDLQKKIGQLEEQNMALMMGMVDVYSAVTTNKGE